MPILAVDVFAVNVVAVERPLAPLCGLLSTSVTKCLLHHTSCRKVCSFLYIASYTRSPCFARSSSTRWEAAYNADTYYYARQATHCGPDEYSRVATDDGELLSSAPGNLEEVCANVMEEDPETSPCYQICGRALPCAQFSGELGSVDEACASYFPCQMPFDGLELRSDLLRCLPCAEYTQPAQPFPLLQIEGARNSPSNCRYIAKAVFDANK